MRAIEVREFGGPDALQVADLPDPTPGAGQVLPDMAACDVLFVDTLIRSGAGAGYFPVRPPYVPGNGVGGKVVAVGESVDPAWLAERRINPHLRQTFPLTEAAKAHEAIEARRTVAKTILLTG